MHMCLCRCCSQLVQVLQPAYADAAASLQAGVADSMPAASKTALAQADGGRPLLIGHTEDTSCSCQQDHCLPAAGITLSPGNEAPTRSWGFLAFLLQEIMLPCSEPIMNLVGPACRLRGSGILRDCSAFLNLGCRIVTWSAGGRHGQKALSKCESHTIWHGMQEISRVAWLPLTLCTAASIAAARVGECRRLSLAYRPARKAMANLTWPVGLL